MKLLSSLLLRKIGNGEAVLFNPDNGKSSIVNPVGALICELLREKELTRKELLEALSERVSGMPEGAAADIRKFLSELQQAGYLADETDNTVIRP